MNGSVSILLIEDDSDHAELIQRAFEERGNGLETTARIIYDQENNATEVQASSRDITERKRSQVELQRAHEDLRDAYDKTIEGWMRALDLRDRETEGHTQRVSEMAIRLARELCCSDEELLHIMHKHPLYAYQMLSPIIYLNQALSLPYYHHERWDGTGYSHGLKGEKIPLFACLFAVVDVWNALSSDRPYRKRVPPREVAEYIENEAGRLFDPYIVERFLPLIIQK